ncbi:MULTISPECIES: hypothetical protein [unclassified Streptomyces]|uniref:hypothetical protein n=1 Tax=unclassified Streptomyces TaxID=2593676 RepID=UPI002E297B3E|nr:hypothetical protein [Streptomyces sp. NBC_00223]
MRGVAPIATMSVLCACAVVAGCGTTATGARREGPAPTATMKTPSTAAPAIAADPAALAVMVRKDTGVSADVREDLTPCVGDRYPMDTDAGDLTEGDGPDLVVNVTTCGDGLGIASYVYRMINGKYLNVFADERPPVYASVEDGRLQIVHEVYRTDDPVAYPTGEEAVTYVWRANRFVQVARSFSDFDAKTPSASPEPTSTDPAPLPRSVLLDPGLPSAAAPGTAAETATAPGTGATPTAPSTATAPAPTATVPVGGR